jgi:hypothetical protein
MIAPSISPETALQLGTLEIPDNLPLLICDVDDVVVNFIADFNGFLGQHGLELRPVPYLHHGVVFKIGVEIAVDDSEANLLIDQFFALHTHEMTALDGAVDALLRLQEECSVVYLTNLPHSAGDLRRKNLARFGLTGPVITNSGPKGPAIRHLSGLTAKAAAFIDDSPLFVASSYSHAPDVGIVHFLHHPEFHRHVPRHANSAYHASDWHEAEPQLRRLLSSAAE